MSPFSNEELFLCCGGGGARKKGEEIRAEGIIKPNGTRFKAAVTSGAPYLSFCLMLQFTETLKAAH